MTQLIELAGKIFHVLSACNGDWQHERIMALLSEFDEAHVTKCQTEAARRGKEFTRRSELECRQNFRIRLRDEYTQLNGRGDDGLEEHMASMNSLDPELAEAFRSMTQSNRLRAIRYDAAFKCFDDAPWGGGTMARSRVPN